MLRGNERKSIFPEKECEVVKHDPTSHYCSYEFPILEIIE